MPDHGFWGVTIGDKHTFDDWGLYMLNKPVIQPPKPKTIYIDVPGSDGVLDMTEAITGDVQYDMRTIKMEFQLLNDLSLWASKYSTIRDYLHGKSMRIVFDDDPGYYYFGRLTVDEWQSSRLKGTITISGKVEPYKYEMTSSTEPWKWDPFNFETGVIRNYGTSSEPLAVNGRLELTVVGSRKSIVPTIWASNDNLTVTFDGGSYELSFGNNTLPQIVIHEGEQVLIFEGSGSVTVNLRGGSL